jgi:hypothetical protein
MQPAALSLSLIHNLYVSGRRGKFWDISTAVKKVGEIHD